MGRYTTNKGITWSDEDGGFEADDILKLAQAYQQNKLATAANTRADTALLMQQEQIAKAEDVNNKIIQGQQLYSDMMIDMTSSGWNEDGVWDAANVNPTERVRGYLQGMKDRGLAGDGAKAYNDLQMLNTQRLSEGGRQFQYKVKQWEEANKEKYGKWYWPGDDTFDEDRMAYIKSIGGERIFRQAWSLGGLEAGPAEGNAQAITGLTSEDFAPSDDWSTGEKVAGGAALVTTGLIAKRFGPRAMPALKSLFKAIRGGKTPTAEVKGLLPHIENPQARQLMSKIIAKQSAGDTKGAIKLLDRFTTKFPELKGLNTIVKGSPPPVGTSQSIITKAKTLFSNPKELTKAVGKGVWRTIPYFAAEGGKLIDESTGAPLPIAQTAGTGWLLNKTMSSATSSGFWNFLKKKFPAFAAKQSAKALGRHAAVGATGIGAHPAVQALMLVGDVGLSVYAVTDLWDEYKKTSK
jgi:hypothetical protein